MIGHLFRLCASYAVLLVVTAGLGFGAAMPAGGELSSTMRAPGWGVEVGRATDSDVGELLTDQNALRLALARISAINKNELAKERLTQLLGNETGGLTLPELQSKADKWWRDRIEGPMERIASNPAASCEESRAMLTLEAGNERQRQLMGLEPTETTAGLVNGKIGTLVRTRCREEKLDECNATGRYEQIVQWTFEEELQGQLYGAAGGGDAWAVEALKECANYELHYVSTTKLEFDFNLDSVIDGRIPIKFKPSEGGRNWYAQVSDMKFEGETDSDVNPFLQSITCVGEGVQTTCGASPSVRKPAFSQIVLMEMKHREDYLDENGLPKSRVVGDNKLKIKFSPALLSTLVVVKPPDNLPSMTFPNFEIGATGFVVAHKKSRTGETMVTFDDVTRGTYPILFEFTRTGGDTEGDITASDTTKFELIHKPNKKPLKRDPTPARRVVRSKT